MLKLKEINITDKALERLKRLQDRIRSEVDVPCKYVVAVDAEDGGVVRKVGTFNGSGFVVCHGCSLRQPGSGVPAPGRFTRPEEPVCL